MVLNEEQRLLHSTIRDFLNQRAPVAALRELRDNPNPQGFDSNLWNELIELGVSSIVLSETHGGFGFAEEYDIGRKFRETRLYQVAPVSTNLILSHLAEHVLGLPRSY